MKKANLQCEIGAVFEVATIVELKLFETDENTLSKHLNQVKDKLVLLPKSVRKESGTVHDDL